MPICPSVALAWIEKWYFIYLSYFQMTRNEYLTKCQSSQPSAVTVWSVIKCTALGGRLLGAVRAQGPGYSGGRPHTLCCPPAWSLCPQQISSGAVSSVLKALSSSTHTHDATTTPMPVAHADINGPQEKARVLIMRAVSLWLLQNKLLNSIKPCSVRKTTHSTAHALPKSTNRKLPSAS